MSLLQSDVILMVTNELILVSCKVRVLQSAQLVRTFWSLERQLMGLMVLNLEMMQLPVKSFAVSPINNFWSLERQLMRLIVLNLAMMSQYCQERCATAPALPSLY
jgi:hypothetical protein